jgi:hypothetical protein
MQPNITSLIEPAFYHRTRCAIRGRVSTFARGALAVSFCVGCGGPSAHGPAPQDVTPRPDAPIVGEQPGAWFDPHGGLTVVGAGRRLRIKLSAPIVACEPAFQQKLPLAEQAARASLTFRVLSETCRRDHPSILLEEESATASPAELERTHHEVARCAATDLGATSGWVPAVVAAVDPCPAALGLGWRLPEVAELQGLTVDDRKAFAGALFEADAGAGFGSLLLYARSPGGQITLVTLSPNGSEQPPELTEARLSKPFFGAALRCVAPPGVASSAPPLPYAQECLNELRKAQASLRVAPAAAQPAELQKLKGWLESVQASPAVATSEPALRELSQLLAAPAIERMAREEREEHALTEHYAELAEGLDDPNVSASERGRRRAEFDNLRKRLGGQIAATAASGSERTQLAALLARVIEALEAARSSPKSGKKQPKTKLPDYQPLLKRAHELRGEKATAP